MHQIRFRLGDPARRAYSAPQTLTWISAALLLREGEGIGRPVGKKREGRGGRDGPTSKEGEGRGKKGRGREEGDRSREGRRE